MTYTVFYACDPGMIVRAMDEWSARQRALVILSERYPRRVIREWDLIVHV